MRFVHTRLPLLPLMFPITLAMSVARADLAPGPCAPQDLEVVLNTGWDENAEALIAPGSADDDWSVLVDPSGTPPPPPHPAWVVTPNPAWLTLPESSWISATPTSNGPNGTYIYETCWCMDDDFTSPMLEFAMRADDQADVLLNGSIILTLPDGTFNDPTAIGISVVDPTKFLVGLNCLVVRVEQLHGGPHGFDLTGSVTAEDGRCCGCYDLPSDAEAWWPLNETVGPIAADIVGGHVGTHSHFTLSGTNPVPAPGEYVVGSLLFDGIEDYVAVPDAPGLDFVGGDDLTIDAWINTTNPLRQPIVHKKDLTFNAPGYAFMTAGPVLTFEMADGVGTVTCNLPAGLDDGLWHFVAVTVDRSDPAGVKLYVGGSPMITTSCAPSITGSLSNALSLSIGAKPTSALGAMWWKGRLDEIEIFRRALTPTEIEEIYLAGTAGKCPPIPCGQAQGPACDGTCPPGDVCTPGPGSSCSCEPPPACEEQGGWPACNGPCPQGLTCLPVPGDVTCECRSEPFPCGETFYPACDGACPQGQQCENLFGTDACHCVPPPAPCGSAAHPACDGACPANEKCVAVDVPAPACECRTCETAGASGLDGIHVGWPAAKDQLRWSGASECALVYNAYRSTGTRLPDVDRDGLADQYGSCFVGEILGLDLADGSAPPPGQVHWYLVTGESSSVEGSLGENSAGVERPNEAPCP